MQAERLSPLEVRVKDMVYQFDREDFADGFQRCIGDDRGVGQCGLDFPYLNYRAVDAEPQSDPGTAARANPEKDPAGNDYR